MTEPDEFWRRPAGPAAPVPPPAGGVSSSGGAVPPASGAVPLTGTAPARSSGYSGPPRTTPPPPGWRPEVVVEVPAARVLPPQEHDDMDREEQAARTITYGVGLLAGAVMFLLFVVLCARVVF